MPLDFTVSNSQRHRREQQRITSQLNAKGEQEALFVFTPPDLDVHLHSPYEAIATLGGDPETSRRWLEGVVGPVQQVKGRKYSFPVSALDRLLSVRAPARVTLDAASLAVARALWARALGLKPLRVTRYRQRITASSGRWPAGMAVTDAPWTAVAALIALGVPVDVDDKAAGALADKLAGTGQHIARAGLAGSAVYLETRQPRLLEQKGLPALAYVGGEGTGRYRMPLLAAEPLLHEPSIELTPDVRAAIKKATGRVGKAEPPDGFPWTLYPFQARDAARGLRILETTGGVLLAGGMGSGKCPSVDEQALTPRGWRRMGDLEVGDEVLGVDGKTYAVEGVYPQGTKLLFKVRFNDGTFIRVSDDQIVTVRTRNTKRFRNLTVRELRAGPLRTRDGYTWTLPAVQPLQFAPRIQNVDPYALGVWIGDGTTTGSGRVPIIFGVDPAVAAEVAATLPPGNELRASAPSYNCSQWSIATTKGTYRNPFAQELDRLGLRGVQSHERFIPDDYLYGNYDQRVALLQGLFDSGGSVAGSATEPAAGARLTTTSRRLADDVAELVRSLGGTARVHNHVRAGTTYEYRGEVRTKRQYWAVIISIADTPVFRLARKAAALRQRMRGGYAKKIAAIEPDGDGECVCITTSAPDSLYLLSGTTPVHNTTVSLACAAILDTWPLLVVSPLAAFSTWARQLGEMDRSFYLASEAPKVSWERIADAEHDAVIISYDRLHAFVELLEGLPFKAIIADELQRISSPGSRRSRALRQLAQAFPLRMGLSGTPMSNTLGDLLPLGAFLVPGEWKPRANAKDLVDLYPGDPVEAVAEHLATLMVRRRIDEVGIELPDKTIRRVFVQLTPEQRRALEDLEREAEEEVEEGGVTKIHVFAKLQKMRQIVGCPSAAGVPGPNPKVRTAVDLAEEFADQGRKSVLFCANRQTWIELGKACEEAGLPWVGIWGSSTVAERLEAERRYHQDDDIKVFIGTLQSCAESLTLSPTGTAWISCDYLYNPSALDQAEARVYRLNQTNDVEIIYLHAQVPGGSLDDRMVEILETKRALISQVVDRRAHVDLTKVHYSLGDLVYLLTGKRDAAVDQREADGRAAMAAEQAKKDHAKATAHRHKHRNRGDVVHDDGSGTMTLEEMRARGLVGAAGVDVADDDLDAHLDDEDGLDDLVEAGAAVDDELFDDELFDDELFDDIGE